MTNRFSMMIVVLAVVAGCSGQSSVVADLNGAADAKGEASSTLPDLNVDSSVSQDRVVPVDLGADVPLVFPDVVPDTGYVGCEEDSGCFLDDCQENSDCLSGWCVEHMGEAVCTMLCQEECPQGWTCKAVGTGPDVVSICVSGHANLCKPCATNADCTSVAEADDACMDYGQEGSFCGSVCGEEEDCPWGFQCVETQTVDGVELKQCIAEAGVCPCTAKSIALGLSTPCSIANEFGACHGKRICAADGLSDCDAGQPAQELCNGLDDDCDGQVDEPDSVGGDFVNLCDDDNDCTQDVCLGDQGCSQVALTDGECKDENPCTVADNCVDGVCVGDPVICDDKNPCTDNACTETGGCQYTPNSDECDDGNPCTVADSCKGGECLGVPVSCDCMDDADCVELEDGDLCNGTPICDISGLPHQCVVDPETVVECSEPDGADAPCLQATCDGPSGECGFEPAHEGMACNDGDACTVGDQCAQGECLAGVGANCNDGNACTLDECDSALGCTHDEVDAECEDGDSCTVGDWCLAGQCQPGKIMACNDGNGCTDDSCQAGVGCVHVPNDDQCSDNNACTAGDHCSAGQCVYEDAVECDDNNPCTSESCDPALGCKYVMLNAPCDDGDDCTIGDSCQAGQCKPGALMTCQDNNPCTDDACAPGVGCVYTANEGECSDNNECTTGDHCLDGACAFDELVACDDDNPCTADSCDPTAGCKYTMTQAPCDDGDICTLGDHCHLGECISSASLVCQDNNPCTDDTCLPEGGCEFTPNSGECDLDSLCSTDDFCQQGKCQPGQTVDCSDSNPCTNEYCDPAQGCVYFANASPCEDGDQCTIGDVCADKVCTAGEPRNCNDGNVCTDDSCNPAVGCEYADNDASCEDGDVCTEADYCAQGECAGGDVMNCSDGTFCNGAEWCEPGFGCKPGEPPNTNDGVQCTLDYCDEDNDLVVHLPDDSFCATGMLCKTDTCDAQADCVQTATSDCCGNGIVEAGEQCDEGLGNANIPDTCRTNCKLPECGDGILDAGEECDDGNQVDWDGCQANCKEQQLVEHYDGFNKFYNAHPVDIHNKQRAIEACENYWGMPCSQGSCGGAQYAIGNQDVDCNNGATQRIWYFGMEGCGYTCNNQDYAGITIKPPSFSGQKNWW